MRGLVSYAHGPAHVFGSRDELTALHVDPGQAYVLASQTTQDRSVFEQLEQELRDRLTIVPRFDFICLNPVRLTRDQPAFQDDDLVN